MKKSICIHGHFYQPPRENPWLEEVELQPSALPMHDWNERITRDCYLPNTAARVVDHFGYITDIINNYSKMDFNIGPTLLSWMRQNEKACYDAIVSSDKKGISETGFGPAISQCYNHMIMPLANQKDKITQVIWGIKDFEFHFGRKPEGMWLPETAVDTESLEALAACGIKFTILSPYQGKRARKLDSDQWNTPTSEEFCLNSPYLCKLPSGKSIAIFFYNGKIASEISFGDLLKNGEMFAIHLANSFHTDLETNQLCTIATDGETFGHHKKFGEMALASCFKFLQKNGRTVTNLTKYLNDFKFEYEVEIQERTSWSCSHGIGRWMEDCSCNIGTYPHGNQKWRTPLREALDFLRDNIIKSYEKEASALLKDPWVARDNYITVILDRSYKNVKEFLTKESIKPLSKEEEIRALELLEMQRHAMLMYTSCGWFFDDISRIETIQILLYAKRVIQLSNNPGLEPQFLNILKKAESNEKELHDGAFIYEKNVAPAMLDLDCVAAHYAISSMFKDYKNITSIFCYDIETIAFDKVDLGLFKFVRGTIKIKSKITWEERTITFLGLNLENYQLVAHLCEDSPKMQEFHAKIKDLFQKRDFEAVLNALDSALCGKIFTIWDLFKDERKKILDLLVSETVDEVKGSLDSIIHEHYHIIQEMKEHSIVFPDLLQKSLEAFLTDKLLNLISNENFDQEALKHLVQDPINWGMNFNTLPVQFRIEELLHSYIFNLKKDPTNPDILKKIRSTLDFFISKMKIEMNLWVAQNKFFYLKKEILPKMRDAKDDPKAKEWIQDFTKICHLIHIEI